MGRLSEAMLGDSYPDFPGAKTGGTSAEAAASMRYSACQLQGLVLAELERQPGTADEIAERLGIDRLAIRPRLSELVANNTAFKSSERRRNASGKWASVYKLRG